MNVSPARSVPPPLPPAARRVPVSPQLRTEPGLNEEWFAAPPTVPRRSRVSDIPPAPARRSGAGAAVALLLIGATLGGTLWLYKSGELPQWSGTAPPSDEGKMEPVSRTEVTNGLMDTTVMTPPPALEGVVIDPNQKPVTTTQDDIEVTESTPAAKPEATPAPAPAPAAMDTRPMEKKPQLGSGPAMPKAKATPSTTSEDRPAQPWAGTSTPATPSAPKVDDTSPSTSPTTEPTPPSTSPTTSPTTSPSTEPTAPSTGSPRVIEDPGF